jgi:signal peptidase I
VAKVSIVVVATFACVCAMLVYARFRWRVFQVPSAAMEPTIQKGERILTDCHAFRPRRGSIVVYENEEGLFLVKRAVALSGDLVEIRDQELFVNGARVGEPYVVHRGYSGAVQFMDNMPRTTVPPGRVFALGDNRDQSYDSRQPAVGPIEESRLRCEALQILTSDDPKRGGKELR